jgi:hypothetical protein
MDYPLIKKFMPNLEIANRPKMSEGVLVGNGVYTVKSGQGLFQEECVTAQALEIELSKGMITYREHGAHYWGMEETCGDTPLVSLTVGEQARFIDKPVSAEEVVKTLDILIAETLGEPIHTNVRAVLKNLSNRIKKGGISE